MECTLKPSTAPFYVTVRVCLKTIRINVEFNTELHNYKSKYIRLLLHNYNNFAMLRCLNYITELLILINKEKLNRVEIH